MYEVPFVFIVPREEIVEHPYIAVIGKTKIADASCLALFQQKVEEAVFHIAVLEFFHATAHADAVQQQVVQIVHL